MRGLDTNVLVRYITSDDAEQTQRAKEIIERAEDDGERLHVNTIVLCELCWTLRGKQYEYDRPSIAAVIELILGTAVFEIQNRDVVQRAMVDYRLGKADFSDYLIGYQNRALGCEDTVTFDRKLRHHEGFSLI
jgi:predicted nucleic-acid-binding protein